nr:type IV secretion system DNA-binding domain-containing protein [Roseovarius tolerans]
MAHRYIIGQSGSGKSSLLMEQMATSVSQGHGVCFIDPHGTDTDALIPHLDATDIKYQLLDLSTSRWNPLAEPVHSALSAKTFSSGIKDGSGYYGQSTPVMDMYLFFVSLSLIYNSQNLTDTVSLLQDETYRTGLEFRDKVLEQFWCAYEELNTKDRRAESASTLNKLFGLLGDPRVFKFFKTNKKTFSLAKVLDDTVLLVRLPIHEYGEDTVKIVGSLIISYLNQLILARNTQQPYDLYLDEGHMFAPGALQSILSGSKKFGLSLTFVHQYIDQVEKSLFSALMGNCPERFVFRVSQEDAEVLKSYMPPMTSKRGLEELLPYTYRRFPFYEGDPDKITTPLESI